MRPVKMRHSAYEITGVSIRGNPRQFSDDFSHVYAYGVPFPLKYTALFSSLKRVSQKSMAKWQSMEENGINVGETTDNKAWR
jgi:hypothetical protein